MNDRLQLQQMLYRALHRAKWDLPDDAYKVVFDRELQEFLDVYREGMPDEERREWEAHEAMITLLREKE